MEASIALNRIEIGLLHTLITQHYEKMKPRRAEAMNDFEFRREAYRVLARKLDGAYAELG